MTACPASQLGVPGLQWGLQLLVELLRRGSKLLVQVLRWRSSQLLAELLRWMPQLLLWTSELLVHLLQRLVTLLSACVVVASQLQADPPAVAWLQVLMEVRHPESQSARPLETNQCTWPFPVL